MDRNLGQTEFLGGLEPGVADDDDVLLVHDNWLAEAKGLDRIGDRGDGVVVAPRVMGIGRDRIDVPQFDVHGSGLATERCSYPLSTRRSAEMTNHLAGFLRFSSGCAVVEATVDVHGTVSFAPVPKGRTTSMTNSGTFAQAAQGFG